MEESNTNVESDHQSNQFANANSFTNTEYERLALANRVNFSDGHARQTLSGAQRKIIENSLELFDISQTISQEEVEAKFLKSFFECGAQTIIPQGKNETSNEVSPTIQQRHVAIPNRDLNAFFTYASSSAIKMAAQYCRMKNLKIYLIEPCFDNILLLLLTEGVEVIPIGEDQLDDLDSLAKNLGPDSALWVVQPNNPTGFCMEPEVFKDVISLVSECKSTIIIDFAFRFHAASLRTWDQYSTLENSNATFIGLEDTGKTWAAADIKVGITLCSADAAPIIHQLHDELLLNVSPLQLLILTEFINDTLKFGIENTVRNDVEINRQLLLSLVDSGLLLRSSEWSSNVPMELLGLRHEIPSTLFWGELRKRGVDILPAHNYYWSDTEKGKSFFRIPLSRPRKDFETAVPIMKQTLIELENR